MAEGGAVVMSEDGTSAANGVTVLSDSDEDLYQFDMCEEELGELINRNLTLAGFESKLRNKLTNMGVSLALVKKYQDDLVDLQGECGKLIKSIEKDSDNFSKILSNEIDKVDLSDLPDAEEEDDDVMFIEATFEPPKTGNQMLQRHGLLPPHQMPIQQQGVSILKQQASLLPKPTGTAALASLLQDVSIAPGMKVFGRKGNDIWYKGTVVEGATKDSPVSPGKAPKKYKVKFDGKGMKVLNSKEIALGHSPMQIMPVGIRIISHYRDEENSALNAYYAGIVAEPPSMRNSHRYLVFFDDGYAQYSLPREIHRVLEQSKNVWEDIHPSSQEFIKNYLQQYPERPMVRLQVGQVVKTEWNGKWWVARVQQVDASLVKMYFDADHRVEWIYRGSPRLEPLYTELVNQENFKLGRGNKRHNVHVNKRQRPVVEYTRLTSEQQEPKQPSADIGRQNSTDSLISDFNRQLSTDSNKKKPVAKKSTLSKPKTPVPEPSGVPSKYIVSDDDESQVEDAPELRDENAGERINVKLPPNVVTERRKYVKHNCGPSCRGGDDDPEKFKGHNLLLIPQLLGWERQIAKQKPSGRRTVIYRTPCGRRCRNVVEIDKWLQICRSKLTIDLFTFDIMVRTDTEFRPLKTFCDIKDLSYGKENVPISCVNSLDRQYPDYVEYSNERTPAKGVVLNLDPEFLTGCNCTDGCKDRNKCACIQKTIEASNCTPGGKDDPSVGYQDRRLKEPVISGIYECNSRCKCNSRCQNRVAQNGLQLRLQVFKTEKRGWGLRCLDDVPAGGFICIYAGQLLTEQGANEDGQTYGDEYLAELDYIEVVEKFKEGYESDVNEDEGVGDSTSEESMVPEEESDRDGDFSDKFVKRKTKRRRHRKRNKEVEKLVIKRDSSTEGRPWSVKSVKTIDSKQKTEEWLSKQSNVGGAIVISDEEDATQSPGTPSSVAGSRKKSEMDEASKDSADGFMMIKDATSMNVDAVESDDSDEKGDELNGKRSTRQRFKNIPDPKSQKPISPIKKPESKKKDNKAKEEEESDFHSTRIYFGEEFCYVMDAKSMGNLGRYLNHNCNPNVFVQNVFVDTHDLRFPWVAFFAGQFIRAGTELTWDYNYDVGSVPGKVLYCYCGAQECRGRLL